MAEQNSSLSYAGSIIRVVLFVLVLVLLGFFLIRWAQNRQASRRAQTDTTQSTQSSNDQAATTKEQPASDSAQPTTENKSDSPSTVKSDNNAIPTDKNAVDSTEKTEPSTARVPNTAGDSETQLPSTGIGRQVIFTGVMLSCLMFLGLKNRSYFKQIRSLI